MSFTYGLGLSWSSPVLPKLQDPNETPFDVIPTTEHISWISSILFLGAFVGCIVYPYIASQFGRRFSLISTTVLMIVCYLVMGIFQNLPTFYVARFALGATSAGTATVGMLSMVELSSKTNRAVILAISSVAVNLGLLLPYCIGPYLIVRTFNFILSTVPAVFLIAYLIFGQETPHFYVSKGMDNEAKVALSLVRRNKEDVDTEIAEMKKKLKEQSDGKFSEMLMNIRTLKIISLSLGLVILQHFCGITVLLAYTQTIFEMAGTSVDSKISSIITGGAQLLSSVIGIFTAQRFGRKPLLIVSCIGMIAGYIPLGTYCYYKDKSVDLGSISFLPVLCLVVVSLMYNNGVGPLPIAISTEMFPSRLREFGTSTVTSLVQLVAFAMTKYFQSFTDTLGLAFSFYFYSVALVLLIIIVHFFIVETKGKTLEQIQDDINRKK